MWEHVASAIALLFIIEGMVPFLYPQKWRSLVARLATISDRQLRLLGLVSMLCGLVFLLFLSPS